MKTYEIISEKEDVSQVFKKSQRTWSVGTLTYTSVGLAFLFFWLLWGDFAWSLKERTVGPGMQILFKKFGATDMVIGLLMVTIPSAISLLLCPVISYQSDRCRSSWGRRIPYLLIPTPFIILSMVGIAYTSECGSWGHHTLGSFSPGVIMMSLLSLGFMWMFFEVATIIANTVFGGLINDVVPHQFLGRFFGLFRAVGLVAGVAFNYWVIGHVEESYKIIFIAIGLVYGLGIIAMCLKVKEGTYPPPVNDERHHGFASVKSYFRESFGNSYYIIFFVALTLSKVAFLPFNSFSVYYAQSMGMSMDVFGKCVALTFVVSFVIAYPLGMLVDRFHVLRITIWSMALFTVINLASYFLVHDANTLFWAKAAQGVAAGIFLTASAPIGQALLPKEKFLQYGSAMNIVLSIGAMIAAPLIGWMLDFSAHEYRHLFSIAAACAFLSLTALIVVYRKFLQHGGIKNYVAP